jgi:hypothetical protein
MGNLVFGGRVKSEISVGRTNHGNLMSFIIRYRYPMSLFVVTCTFAFVGCVPLQVLVYVVLPTCFILINQVCTCGFAHHICVLVFEPILHLLLYYLALLRFESLNIFSRVAPYALAIFIS